MGPLSATDHNNWGTAWAQAGDAERAEEHFREATRLAPGSAAGWANLGAAREELGDRKGALEAYRRAVEIDPASHAAGRIEALER
jgi:Flp pilus assembly protein TadD